MKINAVKKQLILQCVSDLTLKCQGQTLTDLHTEGHVYRAVSKYKINRVLTVSVSNLKDHIKECMRII